jgi:integrase
MKDMDTEKKSDDTKGLNDKRLQGFKPKDKKYSKSDGNGLQITIFPDGRKVWEIRYTFDSKSKQTTIGTYPKVSLKEARNKRDEFKLKVFKGIDPVQEKREQKQIQEVEERDSQNTFEKCAADYFELIRGKISEGHFNKQWGRLKSNIIPFIGDIRMNEIKRDDILVCLTRIQDRGAIEEAHRVYNIVSQVYDYAVSNYRCERNVAVDISPKWTLKPAVKQPYPTITDPKEIGKLLRAIDIYQGTYTVRCALQILPYLALRPGNIRALEWNEVDLEKAILTIPAKKMKMKREHLVPLVPKVVDILRELKKLTGSGRYCFSTSRTGNSELSDNTLRMALFRLGYSKEEIVPHGFRAMFTTLAEENIDVHGCNSDVIEKCTAHEIKNKVRAAYNRAEYWSQRVKLMEWWADFLDQHKNKIEDRTS